MQRMETYLTYQTTNVFRWWFAYRQRLNSHFVAKGEGYLQLLISDFANISINPYPKEAMEFTAKYCTCIQVRGSPNILH